MARDEIGEKIYPSTEAVKSSFKVRIPSEHIGLS